MGEELKQMDYTEDHPECPKCHSDQTDVVLDPLHVEEDRAECWTCGHEWEI